MESIPLEVVARYIGAPGGRRGSHFQSYIHDHSSDNDCCAGGGLVRAVGDG